MSGKLTMEFRGEHGLVFRDTSLPIADLFIQNRNTKKQDAGHPISESDNDCSQRVYTKEVEVEKLSPDSLPICTVSAGQKLVCSDAWDVASETGQVVADGDQHVNKASDLLDCLPDQKVDMEADLPSCHKGSEGIIEYYRKLLDIVKVICRDDKRKGVPEVDSCDKMDRETQSQMDRKETDEQTVCGKKTGEEGPETEVGTKDKDTISTLTAEQTDKRKKTTAKEERENAEVDKMKETEHDMTGSGSSMMYTETKDSTKAVVEADKEMDGRQTLIETKVKTGDGKIATEVENKTKVKTEVENKTKVKTGDGKIATEVENKTKGETGDGKIATEVEIKTKGETEVENKTKGETGEGKIATEVEIKTKGETEVENKTKGETGEGKIATEVEIKTKGETEVENKTKGETGEGKIATEVENKTKGETGEGKIATEVENKTKGETGEGKIVMQAENSHEDQERRMSGEEKDSSEKVTGRMKDGRTTMAEVENRKMDAGYETTAQAVDGEGVIGGEKEDSRKTMTESQTNMGETVISREKHDASVSTPEVSPSDQWVTESHTFNNSWKKMTTKKKELAGLRTPLVGISPWLLILLCLCIDTSEATTLHEPGQPLPSACFALMEKNGNDCPLVMQPLLHSYEEMNKTCCGGYPGKDFHCQLDHYDNEQGDQYSMIACVETVTVPKGSSGRISGYKSKDPYFRIVGEEDPSYREPYDRRSWTVRHPYHFSADKSQCNGVGQEMFCRGTDGNDNECVCKAGFKPSCNGTITVDSTCFCEEMACPSGSVPSRSDIEEDVDCRNLSDSQNPRFMCRSLPSSTPPPAGYPPNGTTGTPTLTTPDHGHTTTEEKRGQGSWGWSVFACLVAFIVVLLMICVILDRKRIADKMSAVRNRLHGYLQNPQ